MNVLHYEIHDHVAVVTLNRPEARNSLNPELIVALAEVWEQIKEDQQVRVAVITGAGESNFCSGFDIGTT